jgi:hypothetical protein
LFCCGCQRLSTMMKRRFAAWDLVVRLGTLTEEDP